jgi:hypothetical protein
MRKLMVIFIYSVAGVLGDYPPSTLHPTFIQFDISIFTKNK